MMLIPDFLDLADDGAGLCRSDVQPDYDVFFFSLSVASRSTVNPLLLFPAASALSTAG